MPTTTTTEESAPRSTTRAGPYPWRTPLIVTSTAALAVVTYYAVPADVNELARRSLAIFVVAALLWATEAIPLYATSLCVIALEIFFLADSGGLAGVLARQSDWPLAADGTEVRFAYAEFFQSFASPIIVLFLGGFLLSGAVSKHGVDRAIATRVLRPLATRPFRLLCAVMGITAFFSMWMSNTATAAMMLALIGPILRALPDDSPYGRGLVLGVAFGANIGGMGTPIGTPPNAVALASLRHAGFDISFVDWMLLGVPLSLILLALSCGLLYFFYPCREEFPASFTQPDHTIHVGPKGRMTVLILLGAILLWLTESFHGIAPSVVALLAATGLTSFRVLDRSDVDSINWNILLLMWGGLSLGHALQATGLVDYIVDLPIAEQSGFILAGCIVALATGLSTFMSNTAAATLIVPMALALSPDEGGSLAILTAFACSFAMAMPVSTPPNAIAFATGRIPVRALLRAGGIVTLIAMLALLAGYQFVIPRILGEL